MNTPFIAGILIIGVCSLHAGSSQKREAVATAPIDARVSTSVDLGTLPGISGSFIRYSSELFRGGDITSEEGVQSLKQQGIASVITVVPDTGIASLCQRFGIVQRTLPLEFGRLTPSDISALVRQIDSLPRPVFIHGAQGVRRAGLLCALWRMCANKCSPDEAWHEYRALGGDAGDEALFFGAVVRLSMK